MSEDEKNLDIKSEDVLPGTASGDEMSDEEWEKLLPVAVDSASELELPAVTADRKLDFIDDDFARELAEYGKKYGDKNFRNVMIAVFVGFFFIGFIPGLMGINVLPLIILLLAGGLIHSSYLGLQVAKAYERKDYRTTSRLMNKALYSNALWAPLSYVTFVQCSQIQSRMLLVQGRYAEMEALLLISRAATERSAKTDGVPKSAFITNDLACTYIAQKRYDEAIEMLKNLLSRRQAGLVREYAALNLALCYAKLDRMEDAEKLLKEHEKRLKSAPQVLRVRVVLVKGLIDLKSGRLDEAEEKLESAIATSRKIKESDELLAFCYAHLAELRVMQDRIDEAELHFRTAIDLYRANSDPSYWSLGEALRDYAAMLEKIGREPEAKKRIREAELYESAYLEREMMRMTYIRYCITQEKPVRMLTELVNVEGFPPLAVELNPPGLEEDKEEFEEKPVAES